jgi:signal transduction histidine kinase
MPEGIRDIQPRRFFQHHPDSGSESMSMPARHTLLVIDSSDDELQSTFDHLCHLFEMVVSRTVQDAVSILKTREVHIILTDQGIPQLLQRHFLNEMAGEYPEAVQTIFTGKTELDLIIDAINQGYVFRYLSKPWRIAELRDVLTVAARQYDQIVERNMLLKELGEKNLELQESNQQLLELDRLKTAFMAVASHELRTPVTLIGGFASLLEMSADTVTPERIKDTTSKISEGARRLERLIRGMFQMLESGEVAEITHFEEVNLKGVVQGVLDDALPFFEKREIQLNLNLMEVPKISADVSKIKDVLNNLLLNAIKFTPDGGQIDLEMSEAENAVEITVRDHGVGIAERDLQHIFEPMFSTFDTLHHSSGVYEFQRRGIGLGLTVSKKFVELHEGTIHLESKVGTGTTIKIRLPVKQNG